MNDRILKNEKIENDIFKLLMQEIEQKARIAVELPPRKTQYIPPKQEVVKENIHVEEKLNSIQQLKKMVRAIDRTMQKIKIYIKVIRPSIKKCYKKLRG